MRCDEQPVSIAVNGVRRVVLSCSPHDADALALGHLVSEGWARSAADVRALALPEPGDGTRTVLAEVDPAQVELAEMVRRHQTLHGCGLRHVLDCDPAAITRTASASAPPDAVPLLRSLFAAVDDAAPDGGVHGVALSDGGVLFAIAIDVARHCAVDRAIGLGLRERGDIAGCGLVATARISGAMALKAARVRLDWIASRSIATSLAHEIAAAFGLSLLERAGRAPRHA
ncbi:MAG TPA: formate dehydrogenase accessory sulfurtransferase FdhD [Longimicrobiales bacterium]